ncbi:MAG: DegT/DnrJ/EryC1/StrS family aminotransferase [Candidatus Omnitrophota bacterium]
MKVPFVDLKLQHNEVLSEINNAINTVIKRSDFILGKDVPLFEQEFAKYCGVSYAVGVSSGTAALFLALSSLGISSSDEVIIPDFTYIATALAVSYTQAKPVFVDIEPDTYNIDLTKLEQAITKNTKAIIPVHLYGQPANMPEILKVAKKYKLKVIEDAAQAHGAKIKISGGKWQKTGALADIGCFSFYPSKNLGCMGDGGMIVTNNQRIYEKLIILRDYGRISKYEHEIIGYNSRLDTLQAAILRVKFRKLNTWDTMRQKAAGMYNKYLSGIPGIYLPYVSKQVKHVYHVYAIRSNNRDKLLAKLKENNIDALIHYPIPIHLQKAYAGLGYKKGDFPVSEKTAREIISLPIYPHLKEAQIKYIAKIILQAQGE